MKGIVKRVSTSYLSNLQKLHMEAKRIFLPGFYPSLTEKYERPYMQIFV